MDGIVLVVLILIVIALIVSLWGNVTGWRFPRAVLTLPEIDHGEERRETVKPWGRENLWACCSKYAGKILHINPNSSLSLQFHRDKEETIMVMAGQLYLELGVDREELVQYILMPGDACHIEPGIIHRMYARETGVIVVEVSTTELDDVVRLADRYGRS